eukprot:TRINITY_DN3830_c0_g1_i3.p1 TRINITY_DN3830_c0_g1~~TRINITY_DN3830_c0_g1_i3.p1  ORF type:complete len:331 (+),score=101.89 TRINITY_DN3830_c0_g1_i3:39-995(+)
MQRCLQEHGLSEAEAAATAEAAELYHDPFRNGIDYLQWISGEGGDGAPKAKPAAKPSFTSDALAALRERFEKADGDDTGVLSREAMQRCLEEHGLSEAEAAATAEAAELYHDPFRNGIDYLQWISGEGGDGAPKATAPRELSEEGLASLKKLFDEADVDKDELLTGDEIAQCFTKYGIPAAEARRMADEALECADADGNGLIDYKEWLYHHTKGTECDDEGKKMDMSTRRRRWRERKELAKDSDVLLPPEVLADLRTGFMKMDEDGSGTVCGDEIAEYLTEQGYEDAGVLADAIMQKCDRDGSGAISYVEFISAAMDQ